MICGQCGDTLEQHRYSSCKTFMPEKIVLLDSRGRAIKKLPAESAVQEEDQRLEKADRERSLAEDEQERSWLMKRYGPGTSKIGEPATLHAEWGPGMHPNDTVEFAPYDPPPKEDGLQDQLDKAYADLDEVRTQLRKTQFRLRSAEQLIEQDARARNWRAQQKSIPERFFRWSGRKLDDAWDWYQEHLIVGVLALIILGLGALMAWAITDTQERKEAWDTWCTEERHGQVIGRDYVPPQERVALDGEHRFVCMVGDQSVGSRR